MTDSAEDLRNLVRDYMDRTGIGPSTLSRLSVRSPGFIAEFMEGRMPRLDTADLVLLALGLTPIGPRFRQEVKEYLNVTGANRSTLGQEALKDPSFVTRLLNGASPELRTVDRVRDWIQRSTSAEERRRIETAVLAAPSSSHDPGGNAAPVASMPFLMNTKELAALLNLSERTLSRYRSDGGGPEYQKLGGSVRYARSKVDLWLARRSRTSTSDPGKERGRVSPEASPAPTEDNR